jgi:hypothetical protein
VYELKKRVERVVYPHAGSATQGPQLLYVAHPERTFNNKKLTNTNLFEKKNTKQNKDEICEY